MRNLIAFAAALVLTGGVTTAFTASLSVPATNLDDLGPYPITPDDLAPPECAGLSLIGIVEGTDGTNGNDLVLGGPAAETVRGRRGDDCVLGGGGDDTLRGNQGSDVCVGGPGNDSLHNSCESSYP